MDNCLICNKETTKVLKIKNIEVGLCEDHKGLSEKSISNVIYGNTPIYELPCVKSSINIINNVVCEYFKVDVADLKNETRVGNIPKAKHWVFFLIDYYQIGLTRDLIADLYNLQDSNVTISINKIRRDITKGLPSSKVLLKYFTAIIDQKIKINK